MEGSSGERPGFYDCIGVVEAGVLKLGRVLLKQLQNAYEDGNVAERSMQKSSATGLSSCRNYGR